MAIKVYRVEHREIKHEDTEHYIGPFQWYGGLAAYTENAPVVYLSPGRHPLPHLDGMCDTDHEMIYGTILIEDIVTWFPSSLGRKAMSDAGFCVRVYETDNIEPGLLGSIQVAVRTGKIREVETLDLANL